MVSEVVTIADNYPLGKYLESDDKSGIIYYVTPDGEIRAGTTRFLRVVHDYHPKQDKLSPSKAGFARRSAFDYEKDRRFSRSGEELGSTRADRRYAREEASLARYEGLDRKLSKPLSPRRY